MAVAYVMFVSQKTIFYFLRKKLLLKRFSIKVWKDCVKLMHPFALIAWSNYKGIKTDTLSQIEIWDVPALSWHSLSNFTEQSKENECHFVKKFKDK